MGCLRLVDRWRYRLRLVHAKKGVTSKSMHKSARSDSPYRFSAKELDIETGLRYFGARYGHSNLSIWISVDPLAGKYPGWTPYRAFFNSPINYTDPDGREEICESCPDEDRFDIYRKSEFEFEYNPEENRAERVNPNEKINVDEVKDPILELSVFMSEAMDRQYKGDRLDEHIQANSSTNSYGQLNRSYKKDGQTIQVSIALDSDERISPRLNPRAILSENKYRGGVDLTLQSMKRENLISKQGPVQFPLIIFRFEKTREGVKLLQKIAGSL